MPRGRTTRRSAVGVVQAQIGRAAGGFSQVGSVLHERDVRVGLVDRDGDGADVGPFHPGVGLKVPAGVDHGDVHRLADLLGLFAAASTIRRASRGDGFENSSRWGMARILSSSR